MASKPPTEFVDPQADLRRQYRAALAARNRAVRALVAAGMDAYEAEHEIPLDYVPFIGLRCGAKGKRTGKPCPLTSIYANGRCRWHGGLSTGPKSEAGKARSAANARSGAMQGEPLEVGKVQPRSIDDGLLAKPSIPLRPGSADGAGRRQGPYKGSEVEIEPQGAPRSEALPYPQPRPVGAAGGSPRGTTVLSRIRNYLSDRPGRSFTVERLAGLLHLSPDVVGSGLRLLARTGRIERVRSELQHRYRAWLP